MFRVALTATVLPFSLVALSSCSQTSSADAVTSTSALTTTTTIVATSTTVTDTTTTPAPTTSTTTTTLPPNMVFVGPSVAPIVAVGDADGDDTRVIQERLVQLGFWLGDVDGLYGKLTRQAVMAFQKYTRLEASGEVDVPTAAALQAAEFRAVASADTGTLIEVDKATQLLFLIVDGATLWTFNTSTGSEIPYEAIDEDDPTKIYRGDSITPSGLWKIDRQRPDGWWDGDLGKIYRPKYFKGGVAVHGMTSIPNYPASHGCVRVSVAAMDFIWDLDTYNVGAIVWVHG